MKILNILQEDRNDEITAVLKAIVDGEAPDIIGAKYSSRGISVGDLVNVNLVYTDREKVSRCVFEVTWTYSEKAQGPITVNGKQIQPGEVISVHEVDYC